MKIEYQKYVFRPPIVPKEISKFCKRQDEVSKCSLKEMAKHLDVLIESAVRCWFAARGDQEG